MSECKARYISLTVIAVEAILAHLLYSLLILNMNLSELSIQGAKLDFNMVISLFIFICIGIFIVLGVFYKIFYYILTMIEVALTAFIILGSAFHIVLIFFAFVVLAPLIFYYAIRI